MQDPQLSAAGYDGSGPRVWLTYWAWVPVLLVAVLVTFALWQAIRAQEARNIQRLVAADARGFARQIENQIQDRINALVRMGRRWDVLGRPQRHVWESDAYLYTQHRPDYAAIQWVDAGDRIRWTVPGGRNEQALGRHAPIEKQRADAMARARETRHHSVSHILELAPGNKGYMVYVPLYGKRFDGFIVGVFRVDPLLDTSIPQEIQRGYSISLVDREQAVYHRSTGPADRDQAVGSAQIRLDDVVSWRLNVLPNQALVRRLGSGLADITLGSGILVSALLALLVHLVYSARRHAAQTHWAGRALRESEVRFKRLTEASFEGIAFHDQGVIVDVNDRFAAMLGYAPSELTGMAIADLVHSPHDEVADLSRAVSELVRDCTAQCRDGSTLPVEVMSKRVPYKGGIVHVMAVRDITERHRVAKLKDELVATVSHELRTPATAIRGALGLMQGGVCGELSEQARKLIEVASNNSNRLVRLINDLLDIEKLESGTMRFEIEPVDLRILARRAVDDHATLAKDYNVSLRMAEAPEPVFAMIDPVRIAQVLSNLVANAVKFSPAGSEVNLAIQRFATWARVSVRDRGMGIPDSFKDQVFEKFAQSEVSALGRKGGTGLGLAICKSIVERLGGKIDFEPRSGGGTTFYFELHALADAEFPVDESLVQGSAG